MREKIKNFRTKFLNYKNYLKYRILMKLIGNYSLLYHMTVKLPIAEEDAAKIICFIQCGASDSLIKFIDEKTIYNKGKNLTY